MSKYYPIFFICIPILVLWPFFFFSIIPTTNVRFSNKCFLSMTKISSPTTTRRRVCGRGHWSWLKGRLSTAIRYEYKQNTLQQGVTIGAQINAIAMATCKSATISIEVMAATTFLSQLKVVYSWGHSGSHYKAVIFFFFLNWQYGVYRCEFYLVATICHDMEMHMLRPLL